MLTYTPPPHMDAKTLIQRAAHQLRAWHGKYGEYQPQWLPPADDVRWMEDAAAYLTAHTLPMPTTGAAVPEPARWCPECRSAGVVGIEQDVCPTCDGTGKVASGVSGSNDNTEEKP